MTQLSYTRLPVDERRRQLLELGTELFTRHEFDDLSMAQIAEHAGISKALLYHYFPSKREYFAATLQQAVDEVAALTTPDPSLSPFEALAASIDAYLGWIEEHAAAFQKLIQSVGGPPEVGHLIESVRGGTAQLILASLGLGDEAPPQVRIAVHAWLWYLDGAILDWLQHRDLQTDELRDLVLATLQATLAAAGAPKFPTS